VHKISASLEGDGKIQYACFDCGKCGKSFNLFEMANLVSHYGMPDVKYIRLCQSCFSDAMDLIEKWTREAQGE